MTTPTQTAAAREVKALRRQKADRAAFLAKAAYLRSAADNYAAMYARANDTTDARVIAARAEMVASVREQADLVEAAAPEA